MGKYTEDDIKSLNWKEHIRIRPGMYIGKTGDGSSPDDGIYVLAKEVIDNSVDEFMMGAGKNIDIEIEEKQVKIRDFGRGIPLGKLVECVSKINTGAKYDSQAFKRSVGLNGVGTKAVNALSEHFEATTIRDGKSKTATFERGKLIEEYENKKTKEPNGTIITFTPDHEIFGDFSYIPEFLEERIWYYAFLNAGLTLNFNEQPYISKCGLQDLLNYKINDQLYYPVCHFKSKDLEFAYSHGNSTGETYYSFVNGQNTTEGGTHLTAFREGVLRSAKDFFKKDFDASDVRSGMIGAISIRIEEPIFESQTKTKLGSVWVKKDELTIRSWVTESVKEKFSDYLHKNPTVADAMLRKIKANERVRKEIANVRKLAKERERKTSIHNKRLRNCQIKLNTKHPRRYESQIFITEGESASGSITKARDVATQAVFSLKGKPLNTLSKPPKVIYENEEFAMLLHALNIADGLENLRYNKIIIATDADVDGMHIRMLLLTFFLQYYPDLVKMGHVYILETPLFRVRTKKKTLYCYSEKEKLSAQKKLVGQTEVTRFKGLGEISPGEFSHFIGKKIRLEPVFLHADITISKLLERYMGKNTPDRRDFIVSNLRVEEEQSI